MTARRAIRAYGGGKLSDNDVLSKYSSLVDRAARRLCSRTGLYDLKGDLWTAGALALVDAHKRFDPTKGARFETFADHRIRGAMLDELRRMDHLPRRLRNKTDSVANAKKRLGQSLGREATMTELSEELGMTVETIASLEAVAAPVADIDEIEPPMANTAMPDETLFAHEMKSELSTAIGQIPERLQLVLSLHYVEELTYREIGKILQVSEPRVCQLHRDAIRKVRAVLAERDSL